MAYRCFLMMLALCSASVTAGQSVPERYEHIAQTHGIPAEVLYAVSLTESALSPQAITALLSSATPQSLTTVSRPWPWTINVAGKGYRYPSRLAAWQALQVWMKHTPLKRIDVGIAQVNLGWHGQRFASTWAVFDPQENLHVAATLLRDCWDRRPGSWLNAIGCYHHPAGGKTAARYQAQVQHQLNHVLVAPTLATYWIEPKEFTP
ncbi:transglycosylase SLT domain-containing protein [Serratia microhaemolytica]|uniref:transglycosylase SLT domain-containing protein n=1 Tax=Serratia microhaemolytica TaxID=2675110 RepID=UPI000FDDAE9C|nr:transglycosylase SLT domain-containing protein [Serratia microhaemolytica]